jgi:DNA repair ATPase RecN
MNKPTPFGKKTFAEYEKEVNDYKEFNLSKVEKVELTAVKDFEKEYNNAAETHTKGMRQTTEIDSAVNKALDLYDAAGKSYLKANARYQEIENAAKELGVDVPSKIEALKKDISQSLKDIDNASKNLIKIKNTDLV